MDKNSICGNCWVIEIKVAYEGQSAEQKSGESCRQIIEKKYATPYFDAVCPGLAIDDTERKSPLRKLISDQYTKNIK